MCWGSVCAWCSPEPQRKVSEKVCKEEVGLGLVQEGQILADGTAGCCLGPAILRAMISRHKVSHCVYSPNTQVKFPFAIRKCIGCLLAQVTKTILNLFM